MRIIKLDVNSCQGKRLRGMRRVSDHKVVSGQYCFVANRARSAFGGSSHRIPTYWKFALFRNIFLAPSVAFLAGPFSLVGSHGLPPEMGRAYRLLHVSIRDSMSSSSLFPIQ
jgi:hypothetical protein